MRKLRVGAVSFAHGHQYSYVTASIELPMVELVAIADQDADRLQRAQQLIKNLQGRKVLTFNDYRELLMLETVDAVIICSTNVEHCEMTVAAAEAGKHVLCEKPLALSLSDVDRMMQACDRAGVYLGTAYPARFDPLSQRVRRKIEDGAIGEVLAMSGTNSVIYWGSSWFEDPEKSGGGCLMDHIVHILDLFRWFSGREPIEVYAEAGTLMKKRPVEDVAMVVVTFEDELVGAIKPCWDRPRYWTRWGDVSVRILGTGGVVEFDTTAQYVERTTDSVPNTSWLSYAESMDKGLVDNFATSVLAGKPPLVTGSDGRVGVAVTLAAYKSAEEHRPIVLE